MLRPGIALVLIVLGLALGWWVKWGSPPVLTSEVSRVRLESHLLSLAGSSRIELAELKTLERLERTSEARVFWNLLKLPSVVVEASVPVTYRYTVSLESKFEIRKLSEQHWEVSAPALTPAPPSADLSAFEMRVRQGSVLRNEALVLDQLKASLTPWLESQARRHIMSVKEVARARLEALIRAWILNATSQDPGRIVVEFAPSAADLD